MAAQVAGEGIMVLGELAIHPLPLHLKEIMAVVVIRTICLMVGAEAEAVQAQLVNRYLATFLMEEMAETERPLHFPARLLPMAAVAVAVVTQPGVGPEAQAELEAVLTEQ
jgi:hypothetical protein